MQNKSTEQKCKEIEKNIPEYLRTKPMDVMIWTYVHAANSLFPSLRIYNAVSLFYKDFGFECEIYAAISNFYTRFARKFNFSMKGASDNELYSLHNIQSVERMLYAWTTFYRERINMPCADSAKLFCEYFSLDWSPETMEMYLRRINDIDSVTDVGQPSVPRSFVING